MKKLIVFVTLLLLLALWGFGFIFPDAGYVLIVLGQKTLETSLWFACFAILAIVVAWWLVSRFVSASWSLAQRITDFFIFGTTERASKRAASGLIDFLSGDWLQARKKLLRTATKVESPLVNYLTAARCSYKLGEREEALKILSDAQKKYPSFAIAIGVAQAKMEMQDGRYEQAKTILRTLQQKNPKSPVVLNSLCKLYEARQDWVALNEIFPSVKKYKACSATEIAEIESSVIVGQLQVASDVARRALAAEQLPLLRKAWDRVPSAQQKLPRVVTAYVRALMDHLLDQEAEAVLQKTIAKMWDDQLVNLYGCLRINNIVEAIQTAESWLQYRPHNSVLLRTLGRLSLISQEWHKARDYFQRSLAVQKNAETYAELARLLNNLGEKQKSMETYQAALQLSVDALPDLPQPSRR